MTRGTRTTFSNPYTRYSTYSLYLLYLLKSNLIYSNLQTDGDTGWSAAVLKPGMYVRYFNCSKNNSNSDDTAAAAATTADPMQLFDTEFVLHPGPLFVVCMYVCMYIYMYVYACMYVCMYESAYVYWYKCIHTHKFLRITVRTHLLICTQQVLTDDDKRAVYNFGGKEALDKVSTPLTHSLNHSLSHGHTRSLVHTHALISSYIHALSHTYTHTLIGSCTHKQ